MCHFVMVPLNLICRHCCQHFLFELFFNLYLDKKYISPLIIGKHSNRGLATCEKLLSMFACQIHKASILHEHLTNIVYIVLVLSEEG